MGMVDLPDMLRPGLLALTMRLGRHDSAERVAILDECQRSGTQKQPNCARPQIGRAVSNDLGDLLVQLP